MSTIDRFRDDSGEWIYRDPQEAEFVLWVWPETHMRSVDNFIEGLECDKDGKPVLLPDDKRDELLELRSEALNAYRVGDKAQAEKWAAALHRACRDAGILFLAVPLARVGRKFKPKGRGQGTIRKAVARFYKKQENRNAMPRDVWAALEEKPPLGWTFHNNRAGKYIEGPKARENVSYTYFSALCKEEREKAQ